jgi:5-(carboxyamino)imidazole ribonucleotide mutase
VPTTVPAGAQPVVGIVMGSASDLPTMRKAADVLVELGVACELGVRSAHRNPEGAAEFAKTAAQRGLKVIIAGAGGAAHLPGVLASFTELPVIGVPIGLANLDGLDSLLSIVQMPSGIPVATVGVDAATNAGILAARILALCDPELAGRVAEHRARLLAASRAQDEDIAAALS